jgi:hypothetical protein
VWKCTTASCSISECTNPNPLHTDHTFQNPPQRPCSTGAFTSLDIILRLCGSPILCRCRLLQLIPLLPSIGQAARMQLQKAPQARLMMAPNYMRVPQAVRRLRRPLLVASASSDTGGNSSSNDAPPTLQQSVARTAALGLTAAALGLALFQGRAQAASVTPAPQLVRQTVTPPAAVMSAAAARPMDSASSAKEALQYRVMQLFTAPTYGKIFAVFAFAVPILVLASVLYHVTATGSTWKEALLRPTGLLLGIPGKHLGLPYQQQPPTESMAPGRASCLPSSSALWGHLLPAAAHTAACAVCASLLQVTLSTPTGALQQTLCCTASSLSGSSPLQQCLVLSAVTSAQKSSRQVRQLQGHCSGDSTCACWLGAEHAGRSDHSSATWSLSATVLLWQMSDCAFRTAVRGSTCRTVHNLLCRFDFHTDTA